MKLIIAGSRDLDINWYGVDCAVNLHLDLPLITEIVSGNSGNVDLAGEEWTREQHKLDYPAQGNYDKVSLKLFPYLSQYGKAGGPIRNKQMAEYADALLLIWDGESRGSANMKKEMLALKKPVFEVILRKYDQTN